MTVYEIPNIEHCTVEEIGSPAIGYRITAHEGWYIHLNDGPEDTANVYKGAVVLMANRDFSEVEIIPEGAEILGDVPNDTETM